MLAVVLPIFLWKVTKNNSISVYLWADSLCLIFFLEHYFSFIQIDTKTTRLERKLIQTSFKQFFCQQNEISLKWEHTEWNIVQRIRQHSARNYRLLLAKCRHFQSSKLASCCGTCCWTENRPTSKKTCRGQIFVLLHVFVIWDDLHRFILQIMN